MSDYELDSFDVNARFKKKGLPVAAWVVICVVCLGFIGSCQNQMDKERAAQQAAGRR